MLTLPDVFEEDPLDLPVIVAAYAHLDTTAQEESATAMSGMFTKSTPAVLVTA